MFYAFGNASCAINQLPVSKDYFGHSIVQPGAHYAGTRNLTQLCKHPLAPRLHPWYKRLSVESSVASRAFYPNLLALVRHRTTNRLNTWNWSRPRGLHSGTRFLEGF